MGSSFLGASRLTQLSRFFTLSSVFPLRKKMHKTWRVVSTKRMVVLQWLSPLGPPCPRLALPQKQDFVNCCECPSPNQV